MKPYVKSHKNDAADADCEAAQRPRFAAVRDAQGRRTRKLLVKQRIQMSIRGQCSEFGVIAPQNRAGVNREVIRDDDRLLDEARLAMKTLSSTTVGRRSPSSRRP